MMMMIMMMMMMMNISLEPYPEAPRRFTIKVNSK